MLKGSLWLCSHVSCRFLTPCTSPIVTSHYGSLFHVDPFDFTINIAVQFETKDPLDNIKNLPSIGTHWQHCFTVLSHKWNPFVFVISLLIYYCMSAHARWCAYQMQYYQVSVTAFCSVGIQSNPTAITSI